MLFPPLFIKETPNFQGMLWETATSAHSNQIQANPMWAGEVVLVALTMVVLLIIFFPLD